MLRCEAQGTAEAPERSEMSANPQLTATNDAPSESVKDKQANDASDCCESSNVSADNKV